jgi:hypothetical protein
MVMATGRLALPAQATAALSLMLIFTDVAYAAPLNSLYSRRLRSVAWPAGILGGTLAACLAGWRRSGGRSRLAREGLAALCLVAMLEFLVFAFADAHRAHPASLCLLRRPRPRPHRRRRVDRPHPRFAPLGPRRCDGLCGRLTLHAALFRARQGVRSW